VTGHQIESFTGRRATIRDVAALAAVSHQTVSRVINGQTSVAEPTRRRVVAAIEQLGYVPSPMARGLISNRTHTLGMVTADVSDGFFARAVAGAETEARRRNYYLIVGSVEESPDDQEGTGYLRLMLDRRVEGLILARPGVVLAGEQLDRANRASIPLVSIGSSQLPGFTVVDVDNCRGGLDATRHLLELGHRTVAHIAGPHHYLEAQQRVAGWRATLVAAGAEIRPAPEGDWSPRAGYELSRSLDPDATAIFVANDQMALGVLRALHEAGRTVPGDVSVVGFDDVPEAEFFLPPLTTIRQDFGEMGRRSLRLLLETMEPTGDATPHLEVAPELVVRASTAPPRIA